METYRISLSRRILGVVGLAVVAPVALGMCVLTAFILRSDWGLGLFVLAAAIFMGWMVIYLGRGVWAQWHMRAVFGPTAVELHLPTYRSLVYRPGAFDYRCRECRTAWTDEWSCACNDRCPRCRAEIEPYDWDDLSVIESTKPLTRADRWCGCFSAEAGHAPDYVTTLFDREQDAEAFAARKRCDLGANSRHPNSRPSPLAG